MTDSKTNTNSLKELVIHHLTQKSHASVHTLHNNIEKQRSRISYHAVHKACRQLLIQGVLKREKNMYSLSPDWVERLSRFVDAVKTNYTSNKPIHLLRLNEFGLGDSRTFAFENLEEADTYRKQLQWEYLMMEGGKKPYCAMSWHLRSPLFASERALNIMNMATKARSQAFILVAGNTPLDTWCADYYRNEFVRVRTGVQCAETCDTMILGDVVVQLHLPTEIRAKLESTYTSTNNVSDLNISDFYKSIHRSKADVKLTVMRNAEIAQQLREQVMGNFKRERLAIFDLHDTLIDGFLVVNFAEYFVMNGQFDERMLDEIRTLDLAYKQGRLSFDKSSREIIKCYASGLAGRSVADIERLATAFVDEGRVPLFKFSRSLFNLVNSYCKTLVITKGTPDIAKALRPIFPFDFTLTSTLETKNGKFTGRVLQNLAGHDVKIAALKKWLVLNAVDMKGSIGFGDSHHDLAFLEKVDTSFVINPTAKLEKIAKQRKWSVQKLDEASDKLFQNVQHCLAEIQSGSVTTERLRTLRR